ncbi:MAG: 4Fe-4S dicluster domain-containing protein [Pseudomonadota bacterium]
MLIRTIREIAAKILEEGKAKSVVGFAKGPAPFSARPIVIDDPSLTTKLIWNDFCTANPVKYLSESGQGAIVANGCISRTLNVLLIEKQLKRERIFIIGVPCRGMLDKNKIAVLAGKSRVKSVSSDSEKVEVVGSDFHVERQRHELMRDNCLYCRHKNPVLYDVLASDLLQKDADLRYKDVEIIEAKSTPDRAQYFHSLFSKCNLCFSCRASCPLCYCQKCFIDQPASPWHSEPDKARKAFTFHLFRAMHMAGRCIDCGACESACPRGIPIAELMRKLNKDIRALYKFEAGLNVETAPALSVYDLTDVDDFILTTQIKRPVPK